MKGKTKFLIVLIALVVVAAYVTFLFVNELDTLRAVKAQDAAIHATQDAQDAETGKLQQQIKDSQTDSWVVKMAHDVLGWVLPGEVKIVNKDQ